MNHLIHRAALGACLSLAGMLATTSASTRVWQNAVDGNFSDVTKWNALPGTGDVAAFTGNPAYPASSSFTVTLTAYVTNQWMRVDGDGPFAMTLNLAGRNYTATDFTSITDSTVVARGGNDNNTLRIEGGGVFSSNGFNIATNATAVGGVTVTGVGTELSVATNDLNIGSSGSGTLNLTNKGKLTTSSIARIGRGNGSVGAVNISDATWAASHEVQFGSFNAGSSGSLTVNSGGKVSLTTAGQNGWLSFGALGSASAVISGVGSEVSAASIVAIGGRGNSVGGNADVAVENGGKLSTTGVLQLFSTGSLSVEDALVSAASLGTVSTLAAGELSLTLSGTGPLVDLSGDVYLDGGASVLALSLQTGASYALNDVIHLIDYGGSLTGTFSNFTEGELFDLGDYQFQFSYEMGTGGDHFIGLTVVPEPSTGVFLLGAAAALSAFRRGRNRMAR